MSAEPPRRGLLVWLVASQTIALGSLLPWLAIAGAALGTLAGIAFGLPGLLLGPFVGAVVGELVRRRDWRQAGRVGLGTALGLALGAVAKLAVVFTMVGLFVAAYLL